MGRRRRIFLVFIVLASLALAALSVHLLQLDHQIRTRFSGVRSALTRPGASPRLMSPLTPWRLSRLMSPLTPWLPEGRRVRGGWRKIKALG